MVELSTLSPKLTHKYDSRSITIVSTKMAAFTGFKLQIHAHPVQHPRTMFDKTKNVSVDVKECTQSETAAQFGVEGTRSARRVHLDVAGGGQLH